MCGIAGIVNFDINNPVDGNVLGEMRDIMSHRGPDGAGMWISPDRTVGLGHRRLSIIDLSEAAGQPMCNEDRTVWIVFNGEIYNHAEIRVDLSAEGHIFRTDHSDTEVIVHAFEEWGPECVHRFRGMFAIAIWDGRKKELWLFRDRIGVKPLYYTHMNGTFIFASEIKALLAYPGIQKAVDEQSLYYYLSFLTTPSPDTLFKGIRKLPPGSCARVHAGGRIEVTRYWDVLDHAGLMAGSDTEVAERVLSELRTAVRLRKVSDVPVGVFLSGGIDSSTNAVLFSEGETNEINTFSIGFDKEYQYYQNEFDFARLVAQRVRSRHFEKKLSENDIYEFLPKLVFQQDEPIADSSCIPTYYVSKLARDNGVPVCQVGEGSDELFCGYPTWKTYMKLQRLSSMPFSFPVKKAGLSVLKLIGKEHTFRYEWLRRVAHDEPIFWGGVEGFADGQKSLLLSPRLRSMFKGYSSFEALKPIVDRFNQKAWEKSPLSWMTYMDLNMRLPELLLMRVDKMSMAVSLEARVPFLDHKFVELVMSIPESVKVRDGELKHILKKAVSGLIPDEILYRKKQGFSDLLNEWFYEKFGDIAASKIRRFAEYTDYFDRIAVDNLISARRYTPVWILFNFVLWHEKWIEGKDDLFS